MPLSLHFSKDIDSVVVTQSSAHLVIIHTQMILLDTPQPGQTCWINNLEHTSLFVLPLDVGGVSLTRIIEELL